eukprot:CAMPEP_0117458932 /NCGR_PEP_ID=MMETSP0784-20121206/1200_1 /TAXON_ID=39447 /ORGANISM="" /LENGTH=461 /DNA_ID=CAMNT_0005252495 /DNA_START=68 /DNA_END=1448 /DNA_ORIENTATION=+
MSEQRRRRAADASVVSSAADFEDPPESPRGRTNSEGKCRGLKLLTLMGVSMMAVTFLPSLVGLGTSLEVSKRGGRKLRNELVPVLPKSAPGHAFKRMQEPIRASTQAKVAKPSPGKEAVVAERAVAAWRKKAVYGMEPKLVKKDGFVAKSVDDDVDVGKTDHAKAAREAEEEEEEEEKEEKDNEKQDDGDDEADHAEGAQEVEEREAEEEEERENKKDGFAAKSDNDEADHADHADHAEGAHKGTVEEAEVSSPEIEEEPPDNIAAAEKPLSLLDKVGEVNTKSKTTDKSNGPSSHEAAPSTVDAAKPFAGASAAKATGAFSSPGAKPFAPVVTASAEEEPHFGNHAIRGLSPLAAAPPAITPDGTEVGEIREKSADSEIQAIASANVSAPTRSVGGFAVPAAALKTGSKTAPASEAIASANVSAPTRSVGGFAVPAAALKTGSKTAPASEAIASANVSAP